jgi:flagellar M-ring protein FliF
VSAAVVVNFRRVDGKPGDAPSFKALSPKEIEQITNLSREAMGFSKERGDTLNVVNAAFPAGPEAPAVKPIWEDPQAMLELAGKQAGNVLIGLLVAYLVFGVLRPAVNRLTEPPEPAPDSPEAMLAASGVTIGEDGQIVLPAGAVVTADGKVVVNAEGELDDASQVRLSGEAKLDAEAEAAFMEDIEIAKKVAAKDAKLFANVLKGWMDNG